MALDNIVGELAVLVVPDTTGFGAKTGAAVSAQTTGIGGKAGKTIGVGMAAGAAAAFGKGISDFAGFERGMNEVFTLIPEAGQASFDKLTEQSKAFASEFGVLPDQVVKPLYDSLSAGVPKDNVFDFLETANAFSKAGAVDLSTSVDALTTGVNAFGLEAEDAGRVSDSLFTAVKGGKTTVEELAASLFQVAPVAGSFGIQVEEVSAALATLTAAGTPTAQASTQIKGAIAELGKEGTKANKAFQEFTGKGFTDFIAEGGTFEEAAQIMAKGADEAGLSVLDMFGSIEAGQGVLGLTGDKAAVFAKNLEAQAEAAGATQVAFEQMEKGIGPALDKIKARLSVAFLNLGETLAPTVETVGVALAGFVNVLSKVPGPILAIAIGAVGMTGALLALSGPILRTVKIVGGLGKAIGALTKILAANPYILLIAATIALAYIIYKNWDSIKEVIMVVLDAIGTAITASWNFIKDITLVVWGAITTAISASWGFIKDITLTVVGAIVTAVTASWDFVKDITVTVWGAITTAIVASWNFVKSVTLTVVGAIVTAVTSSWNFIKEVTSAVWGAITGVFTAVWDAIKLVFTTALEAVALVVTTYIGIWRTVIETGMNVIHEVIDRVWNAVLFVTDRVWNAIMFVIDIVSQGITNIIHNFSNPIDFLSGIMSNLGGVVEGVWNGISGAIEGAVNIAIGAIDRLKSAISSIPSPGDIAGGIGNVLGSIPGFDLGGIVPGPTGSPQLILAHGGETVLPTHKYPITDTRGSTPPGATSGEGSTERHVHFHLDGPISVRNDDDILAMRRSFYEQEQRDARARGEVSVA